MSKKPAQIIAPDAYPQMLPKAAAAKFALQMRSSETAGRAARAVKAASESLHDVVRGYVDAIERGAGDGALVYEKAHDIRGLAESAGLAATGRIAESLCRYLDQLEAAGLLPEAAVVRLHIDAMARAARAQDQATRMGEVVAGELAQLVNRKLSEALAVRGGAGPAIHA